MPLRQILSGGQTGVDRAALDVALERGFPCGGWCPRGRLAEDGAIPERYPLQETPRADYEQRTEFNVRDADGTLILTRGPLTGGTALTKSLADRLGKPCLVIDLQKSSSPAGGKPSVSSSAQQRRREPTCTGDVQQVLDWIGQNQISVLNVAGPRESQQPGISEHAAAFLRKWLNDR